MQWNSILEWSGAVFSLLFLFALIARKTWAWPAGIAGSAVSVVFCYRVGLYAETGLYVVYVLMGFYGWYQWRMAPSENDEVALVDVPWRAQWPALLGIPLALLLAFGLSHLPGVSFAIADSFTSVFALIATYQETRRIRTAFHYWIPINLATVGLYAAKGMWVYAALMVVYSVMSVFGYLRWRK